MNFTPGVTASQKEKASIRIVFVWLQLSNKKSRSNKTERNIWPHYRISTYLRPATTSKYSLIEFYRYVHKANGVDGNLANHSADGQHEETHRFGSQYVQKYII